MNNSNIKILIVDDEPDILEFLAYNLNKQGFKVSTASNGVDAISIANQTRPHLILLDIMMPKLDGVETCIRLRENKELNQTLIAFLTARNEEYSQIAGLEAGADDYIQKPIRPRLLISRLNALLRRHRGETDKETSKQLQVGPIKIDKEKYQLHFEDKRLDLAKKEFDILWLLLTKPGKVFARQEIYRKIWGTDIIVGNRTLDVHISKLREKVGPKFIKTIKGIGYKFEL